MLRFIEILAELCPRYVAKIIFTYILGYKVDVGHMEAVNLISSTKYSEKQIVCITCSILINSDPLTNAPGLLGRHSANAREFGLPASSRQFH